jgi:tetratricopeptide (TPR) repeat protein
MNTQTLLQEALALHERGAIAEAADRYGRVLQADPNNVEALFRLGRANCQQGRFDAGIELFQRALKIDPQHARSLNLLGLAFLRTGRPAEALTAFDRAIAADPKFADPHANKGDALSGLGRLLESIREYDRSLELEPGNLLTLTNRGAALHQAGRFEEALRSFDLVLGIDPNFFPAHENRAKALSSLNRHEETVAATDRAIALNPKAAMVHWIRGLALLRLNKTREGFSSLDQAIGLNGELAASLTSLGALMLSENKTSVALAISIRALQSGETQAAKSLFAESAIATEAYPLDDEFRGRVAEALEGPWVRPADLARTATILLKLDKRIGPYIERAAQAWPKRLSSQELFGEDGLGEIAGHRLLIALLRATPIHDAQVERFLTCVRRIVLQLAASPDSTGEDVVKLGCALAQQCFMNEYIYDVTPEELGELDELRQSLTAALEAKARISPLRLAAFGAYMPLASLPNANALLKQDWPAAIGEVINMQVREPVAEAALRKAMRKLTPIDDALSAEVQGLYEENPYPRWAKASTDVQPLALDLFLGAMFPASTPRVSSTAESVDILVAGCGTGREPIEFAQAISGARMLAIDLSVNALAYAKQKAHALGVDNIDFAQADILKLGSVDRQFDLILASGVLHHFSDPATAWKTLLSLLRPRGVMRVSFYSAAARRVVDAARAFAAERGFQPSPDGIRHCRQEIMDLPESAPAKAAVAMTDFFTLSEARYVLFQPPEQHMTLSEVARFVTAARLEVIGLEANPDARTLYAQRFPAEKAMTDLNNWQNLERERHDILGGTYAIWVQKP